ncbi:DNA polymerase ligase-domain-containing protein [Biscogniauxia mediterranea]|nr:DNA polymerase ligase-domain-containing protein [Biscogniauxia mediterranea]
MASKRGASPGGLVQNPFIKKRNLEWNLDIPGSGTRDATESHSFRSDDNNDGDDSSNEGEDAASSSKRGKESGGGANNPQPPAGTSASASASAASTTIATKPAVVVAASEVDRAGGHFSALLARATLSPFPAGAPRLAVERYRALYERSWGSRRGAHFVVHQHDHPVAGLHYDLRLQINATSSASWAVMYGLPGDPDGARQNRNATETRVHCLWNHLMETGSHTTGSLLIWDTGTYSVLPPERNDSQSPPPLPPSPPPPSHSPSAAAGPSEQENLSRAFRARKIRLRLRGARLPDPYVINLRLPLRDASSFTTSSSTSNRGRKRRDTEVQEQDREQEQEKKEQEKEQQEMRRTNAYAGATNSIGSVHQRRWFLSLDRGGSGFVARQGGRGGRKGRKVVWEREGQGEGDAHGDGDGGDGEGEGGNRLTYPFYVRGLETERSVVTGRLAAEVLRDEGVVGYVSRRGWRGVTSTG